MSFNEASSKLTMAPLSLLHLTSPSSSLFLLNFHLLFLNAFFFHIFSLFSEDFSVTAMKITSKINPKNLFRAKKSRSVSRSEQSSFSSSATASSDSPESSHHHKSKSDVLLTPKSVLQTHSPEISSDEWSEISSEVQYELVQAFRIIDSDGDGRITRAELAALLSRVGGAEPLSPEELSLMLSEVDRDGDGSISLEEFGAISSAFGPPACDAELRGMFDFFDTDHDGRITEEELFAVFKSIGDGRCTLEDCRRMIRSVDKNGDGFVCFEDFTRMMEQQR